MSATISAHLSTVRNWLPIVGEPAVDRINYALDQKAVTPRVRAIGLAVLAALGVGFILHMPFTFLAVALVAGTILLAAEGIRAARALDVMAVEDFVKADKPTKLLADCIRQSLTATNLLIEMEPNSLNKIDENDESLVDGARFVSFKALVEAGVEFYKENSKKSSGLTYAVKQKDPAFIKCLEESSLLPKAIEYVKKDADYCKTLWENVNTKEAVQFLKKHEIFGKALVLASLELRAKNSKEEEDRIQLIRAEFS